MYIYYIHIYLYSLISWQQAVVVLGCSVSVMVPFVATGRCCFVFCAFGCVFSLVLCELRRRIGGAVSVLVLRGLQQTAGARSVAFCCSVFVVRMAPIVSNCPMPPPFLVQAAIESLFVSSRRQFSDLGRRWFFKCVRKVVGLGRRICWGNGA